MASISTAVNSASPNIKLRPIATPAMLPKGLKLAAKFKRQAACAGGPSSVTYGFAAVSKKARPAPMTRSAKRKAGYENIAADGRKSNDPHAKSSNPQIIDDRYEKRTETKAAGNAKLKYPM
jgi:hypothetical protein